MFKNKLKECEEPKEWLRSFRADCEEDRDMTGTGNPGIPEAIREVREIIRLSGRCPA